MAVPQRLIDEITDGDCVAFVGAGFTAPVVPEWRQLLADLADSEEIDAETAEGVRALIEAGSNRDLGAAAQTIRDEMGEERFFAIMQERLADPPLNDPMRHRLALLHGIPFRAILTTNFDGVLEGEAPNREAYLRVLRPEHHRWWDRRFWDEERRGAAVVKLHGTVEKPDQVVFTHRDYRRLYASPAYSTFLRSVMASTTVLYLGFSFSDAYLNELRSEILALLDHRGGDVPVAYAIVNDASPAEMRYSAAHEGIHVLPVDTKGGSDYSGFDAYLAEIHDRTNPRQILARLVEGRRIVWVGEDHLGLRFLREAAGSAGGTTSIETLDEPVEHADLTVIHHSDTRLIARFAAEGSVVVFIDAETPSAQRRFEAIRRGAGGYAADWSELLQEVHRILRF